VRIALGSLAEIETQMEVARRRGYVDDAGTRKLEEQIARTGQLLHGILRSLRRQALAALTAGTVSALVIVTFF
jgi:four helix bundle protein